MHVLIFTTLILKWCLYFNNDTNSIVKEDITFLLIFPPLCNKRYITKHNVITIRMQRIMSEKCSNNNDRLNIIKHKLYLWKNNTCFKTMTMWTSTLFLNGTSAFNATEMLYHKLQIINYKEDKMCKMSFFNKVRNLLSVSTFKYISKKKRCTFKWLVYFQ